MRNILVTAALPYSNGRPHVGHMAGAYIPADTYVRFERMRGNNVRFICGSDDHGVAIMLTAEKEGKTAAEVAKFYHTKQLEDFKGLGIDFDIYGSTSQSPYHTKVSQDFFRSMHEKGYFEKKISKQFFDESAGIFLPDRYVKGTCAYCGQADQNGDQCENCGKALEVDTLQNPISVFSGKPASLKDTVHWYLDLSRFEGEVKAWFDKSFLRDQTRGFVQGLLSSGLVSRSMTRDIPWGIPLPLEDQDAKGKVLYVWFDAPIGYISNTLQLTEQQGEGAETGRTLWQSPETEIVHFIGEDNAIFHCVIWIAMLAAEGSYQLPRAVIVNQFLNIQFPGSGDAEKISKSRGTAVWIGDYLASGANPDSLRYYLTTIAPEKARTVYKPEDLIQKNNADLANTLGNFVNRVLSFSNKYYGPSVPAYDNAKLTDRDQKFYSTRVKTVEKVTELLESYCFKQALDEVMEFARECNRYIDEKAPWTSRKTDEEATKLSLAVAMDAIFTLAILLSPFLPSTGAKMLRMLGIKDPQVSWGMAAERLSPGQNFGEIEILFEKMEFAVE
jgi:methionyl-tRNA synthetase